MYTRNRLAVFVAALGVAGCPAGSADASDDVSRVFVGSCVFETDARAPRAGALFEATTAAAIRGGLGRLAGTLRAAGASRSRVALARLNLQLEPGESPGCAQFVHGTFTECRSATEPWSPPLDGLRDDDARRELLAAGICLAGEPAVFVELALRRASGGGALALAPTLLHFGRTLDGRGGGRERALALQLAFHPPGAAADDRSATGGSVVFGTMRVGRSARFETARPLAVRPHESAWFPSPFPPAGTARSFVDRDTTSGSTRSTPSTITATLIETRDERPLLLLLADMLEDSNDELEAELHALALRDRRHAAQLEADRRRELAFVELESKRTDALLAQFDYCALPDDDTPSAARARLEASTGLFRARVEANLAADAAGRPRPFRAPTAPSAGPRTGC